MCAGVVRVPVIEVVEDCRESLEDVSCGVDVAELQVAMRAGHDPSVAAKHYTGSVAASDRALAEPGSEPEMRGFDPHPTHPPLIR